MKTPITSKYITPSTTTFKLDKPDLLIESDFESINLKSETEKKFWKKTYYKARKVQNIQKIS